MAPESDELAYVTSLQIYLRVADYRHIDRASLILARTPALRSLDLELEGCDICEDQDCCDGAVNIIQMMFSSRIETGATIRLRSLRITSMCLLYASMLLLEVLDLGMLEHLQLVRCIGIDPFLRYLEALNLDLSSLCIEDCFRFDTTDFAVNDFIRSLKPLKRITLKFMGIWFFDLRTLQPHYTSLESLRIEDNPLEQAMLPTTRLAPNLEQLALFGFKVEDGRVSNGSAPYCDIQDLLVCYE